MNSSLTGEHDDDDNDNGDDDGHGDDLSLQTPSFGDAGDAGDGDGNDGDGDDGDGDVGDGDAGDGDDVSLQTPPFIQHDTQLLSNREASPRR